MSRVIAFALIASLAVPAASLAAERPTKQKNENYSKKKICRSEATIGSRLAGTTKCRTQAEWDAEKEETRRTVQRIQDFKPASGG